MIKLTILRLIGDVIQILCHALVHVWQFSVKIHAKIAAIVLKIKGFIKNLITKIKNIF